MTGRPARRWLAALLAALGLAALALAGCARSTEPPAARPAVWRATNGAATLWLVGTVHLLPPGLRWQDQAVAQAVRASDTLVTEIPAGDPAAQAATFLRLARASGLPPLVQRVATRERDALAAAIARAGIPPTTLDRMTTWGAALALGSGLARDVGGTRAAAPEAVLAAAFADRRHEALETFEGQLGIFAALPEAAQRQLLRETIRGGADPAAEYQRLLTAWRTGDPAAIERAFNDAFAGAPDLRAALVTNRNRAWADVLAKRRGTALVAVGAGHLVGSDGLPALLSARGFRVARVR